MSRKKRRNCTQLERIIILDQNATTTKRSLSLTTSPLIRSSGKLVAFFYRQYSKTSFSSVSRYRLVPLCVDHWFQTYMGRGAEAQS